MQAELPEAAPAGFPPVATLRWSAQDIARLADWVPATLPVLGADSMPPGFAGIDVWDCWPLADPAGQPVPWRGGELWFALAAPKRDDPEARHFAARIHAFHRRPEGFRPLGPALPDGLSPGNAEWSGAARLEGGMAALYFTVTGTRGGHPAGYRQRLFVTRAALDETADGLPFRGWSEPRELLAPGCGGYLAPDGHDGRPGEIKAFRDPFPWRGPDGADWLLFTGSSARDASAFNGLIGLARHDGAAFRACEPLVDACGTNNELERPHLIAHGGRLYLLWSTQAGVFAPGIAAPTGLYGAVAERIEGPWQLLNGHGLVLANPPAEPFQCYSWWVLPDLSVAAFVDYWGVGDARARRKPAGRAHFGGTFAPFVRLRLEGDRAGPA